MEPREDSVFGYRSKRSQDSAESGTGARLLHLVRMKKRETYVASFGTMLHDSWNGLHAIYVRWSRTAEHSRLRHREGEHDSSATIFSSCSSESEL